ncbi:hypothetical protein PPTG_20927 [Phytophthora nicotianae INRA-310]|uniref:DDE-1 domain-containing protein n=1 Tax=Phytophthora nicotianae (strain INRA-310) TaxID=761204 RepID=W2RCQ6_PHYN3|nr:hypothetical protein PPTG_20927 [Phytophthora nicotianae INRA-310]ETN22454.1 hypothetical protein PPTG_20927 [Phytophthora nicotianae INRA-310]
MQWIERPSVDGCRLLILDSLKVHRMASVGAALRKCCTQVQFVPVMGSLCAHYFGLHVSARV